MSKGSPISPSLMAHKTGPARSVQTKSKDAAFSVNPAEAMDTRVQGPNNIVPPTEMTGSQAIEIGRAHV